MTMGAEAGAGRDAILDEDGRSFAAVKAERLGGEVTPEAAAPKRSRKPAAA